jgi:enamine deaminase RidA (YjgF/YER057c/UK114 family)
MCIIYRNRGKHGQADHHLAGRADDRLHRQVVLRNIEDFPAFNEAFREAMQGEKLTRTCVGATPHRKGVNVEIDCVASFD